MKLFIVENQPMTVTGFTDAISELHWSYYMFSVGKDGSANEEDIKRFLNDVCKQRPDVVVLDAALTTHEEALLDKPDSGELSEESLSGFKYCRALAMERLGIPIVFLTRSLAGQVPRIAMRVGADRVLVKNFAMQCENLIQEIEILVRTKTPHDSAFYWPLRNALDAGKDMWERDQLRKALDRYYLNASSVKRFGLLTASLRGILSPLFQGDANAETKLMLSLVKSQMLLSLVDPRLRDHVKHTGNVFWVGYRLLHDIEEFKKPESLSDHVPALYDASGPLTPRDQLASAWTLAALFHDYGYVDERQSQLVGLVKSLVPGIAPKETDVRSEKDWTPHMELLRQFADDLFGNSHFLYHYIDQVMSNFGREIDSDDKKIKLIDHGFLSAHRLLAMIPFDKLDAQKKKIVLHAALAIAYHNYAEILRKWKLTDKCKGNLTIGALPVCSLLAFSDSIQTWDRESEIDPALARTQAYDGLLERLVLSDTAYVTGSEISEFLTKRKADNSGYDVKLRLRYFVEAAGGIQEVCESLGQNIQRWIDSDRLKDVCNMTGMSSILHGQIVYELPMLAGTRTVTF